ncbi:hypothetical protein HMY34_08270 [Thiothrix subterranea]|uniref:hypothetical protein n=1 Tax=Thiothrix subterranea TaxID=2735563 RepID=UPI00192B1268|nr:hypothetical protein [Thiothrix subterranea]QQZ28749.1 hypothetical protein HMY34_08270 [Thiothrix subterranea]
MKLKVSLAMASLVFISSSLFADTGTPDILSSISSGEAQELSNAESAKVRGEYRYCFKWSGSCSDLFYSSKKPTLANTYAPPGTYLVTYGPYFGYYASR